MCGGTEASIVAENNNCGLPPRDGEIYGPDPINVYNAVGKHVGYSWDYGDSVELVVDMQNTVLRVSEDHIDELKAYLSDKEIEINFINMRGEVCYTFYMPAGIYSRIRLNCTEDTLIEKNTYTCTLVLINPYDLSRINLLPAPYKVYVK